MTGPMVLADGTEIPPKGKPFEVDFCTDCHAPKSSGTSRHGAPTRNRQMIPSNVNR